MFRFITYIKIAFFTLFLLFGSLLPAQNGRLKKANKLYNEYAYIRAINIYERIDNKDIATLRKLAHAYVAVEHYQQAADTYAEIVKLDGATDDDYYNYAMMLRQMPNYHESKAEIEKYIADHIDDSRGEEFHAKEELIENMVDDHHYLIKHLNFNTEHVDFGVMKYGDGVAFVSSNEGAQMIKRKWNWNQKPYLDIYQCDLDNNLEFKNIRPIELDINTSLHEGRISFSENEEVAIMARNYESYISDKFIPVHLYEIRKDQNGWKEERLLDFIEKEYSYSNPYLSSDGKTVYFSSNMPGGYGGADIYKSEYENGKWKKPVNLGSKVNTAGNEVYPYLDEKNEQLYFSSDGHIGIGGLDIFKSKQEGTGFGVPENVGIPLNSREDDFALMFLNDKFGYFSSNRNGGRGSDDIYRFEVKEADKYRKFTVVGEVVDGEEQRFPNAYVEIIDENVDIIMEPLLDSTRTDSKGQYSFAISDKLEDEDFEIETQFWVIAKAGDIYESKNPELIDEEKQIYKADFLLDVNPEVSIDLDIQDEVANMAMEDVKITMVDNETSAKRVIIPDSSHLKIGLPGKHVGDKVDYDFYIEKSGYQTQSFSYAASLDSEGAYVVEKKIRRKVFNDISFVGVCKDGEGSLLPGVAIDLMDAQADVLGTIETDENGAYRFDISVEEDPEAPTRIEDAYWLFAKYEDKYDSKNPLQDIKDSSVYLTNFVFEPKSEITLKINVSEEGGAPVDAKLIIVDQQTSKKKEIAAVGGAYSFNLNDKRVGETLNFKIQAETPDHRPEIIDFQKSIDTAGQYEVFVELEKREFKEVDIRGLVRTPQGERLKGVHLDLMDDEANFVGSSATNRLGEFNFKGLVEIIPGKQLNIEEQYWLFAKYKEFYDSQNPQPVDSLEDTYFAEFIFDEEPELSFKLDISEETKDVALDNLKITVTDNETHLSKVIVPERSKLKIGLNDKTVGSNVDYSITLEKEGFDKKEVLYKRKLDTAGVYVIKENIIKKKFEEVVIYGIAQNEKGEILKGVEIDVMDAGANFVGSQVTGEDGTYRFELKIPLPPENTLNVEKDYWLFAKYKTFYESKNPVQTLGKDHIFEANFLFKTEPEISLQIGIRDKVSEKLLSDYNIRLVNNETNEQQILQVSDKSTSINLPEKRIGDVLNYQIMISKKGYETTVVELNDTIASRGKKSYLFELEQLLDVKINISGYCKSSSGKPISGVSLDLMNADMEMVNSTSTDARGFYDFELSKKIRADEQDNLKDWFWVMASFKAFYDTRNLEKKPGEEKYNFMASFVFDESSDVSLKILVQDRNKEELDNVSLMIVDNRTSSKKDISSGSGTYIYHLPDKRLGEMLDFTIQVEKEGYRSAVMDFQKKIDSLGEYILIVNLDRKVYKEVTFTGIVRTPQGDRLKGVNLDLMDEQAEFVGSAQTNEEGVFKFTTMVEIIPELNIKIDSLFWLFAKYKEFYDSKNPQKVAGEEYKYYSEFVFDEKPELSINLDISEEAKEVALDKLKITVTDNDTRLSKVIVPERSNLKIGLLDKEVGNEVDYSILLEKEGYENKEVFYKQKLDTAGVYVIRESIEKKKFEDIVVFGLARNNKGELLKGVEVDLMDPGANFLANGVTNEEGKYRMEVRVPLVEGKPLNIEGDFWLFGKYESFYDSKNPVSVLGEKYVYEANFLFKTDPEIILQVALSDGISGEMLSDYDLEIYDNLRGTKKMIKVNQDSAQVTLDDKRIGDLLDIKITINKEGYQPTGFIYKTELDREGVFMLERKVFPVTASISTENQPDSRKSQRKDTVRKEFDPVYFDFDSYAIKTEYVSVLQKALMEIRDYGKGKLIINAYTDPKGSAEYNLRLSNKRLEAVLKWLIDHGLPPEILVLKNGYGESKATGELKETDAARERKVELIFSNQKE